MGSSDRSMAPHRQLPSLPIMAVTVPRDGEPEVSAREVTKKRSKYRLASTFELSDEQPTVVRARACSVPRPGQGLSSSHSNLFGPPTPAIVRKLRRIEMGREEGRKIVSKKPLPVNPLTGIVMGKVGPELPTAASNRPESGMVRTKSMANSLHSRLW